MSTPSYDQWLPNASLYVNGLIISKSSNTQLSIAPGAARDSSNTIDMILPSDTILNAASNGANGLDTGTLAVSTTYYVYLIADITNSLPTATLLSTNSSTPIMPGGYGFYRRIGWWSTDSAAHFNLIFESFVNSTVRYYYYDTPITVLSGGTSATQVTISIAQAVPAISNIPVTLNAVFTPNAASNTATFYPAGSTGTSTNIIVGQVAAVPIRNAIIVPLLDGQPKFDYKLSTASAALTVSVQSVFDSL